MVLLEKCSACKPPGVSQIWFVLESPMKENALQHSSQIKFIACNIKIHRGNAFRVTLHPSLSPARKVRDFSFAGPGRSVLVRAVLFLHNTRSTMSLDFFKGKNSHLCIHHRKKHRILPTVVSIALAGSL